MLAPLASRVSKITFSENIILLHLTLSYSFFPVSISKDVFARPILLVIPNNMQLQEPLKKNETFLAINAIRK